jgi:hypothetical protein
MRLLLNLVVFKELFMLTRQELMLNFMFALASNSQITAEKTADEMIEIAKDLSDAYLKTLG